MNIMYLIHNVCPCLDLEKEKKKEHFSIYIGFNATIKSKILNIIYLKTSKVYLIHNIFSCINPEEDKK
jgi:hypothetical protein